MSKIIEYLRELGLINIEKIISFFTESDLETLAAFNDYMGELAFEDWKISEYTPYAFAPSMDVSGFGGCSALDCKIKRASKFIKFSSLYSDCIYLIVNSITNPHNMISDENYDDSYRNDLISDYSLILLYSDLISAGIARIIPANFSVCPNCYSEYVFNINDFEIVKPVIQDYAKKAVMTVTDFFENENISLISLSNVPELFPDHDGIFALHGGMLADLSKEILSFPYEIRNEELIYDFVEDYLLNDFITTKLETFVSSTYQSKYITSKISDKTLLDLHSKSTIGNTPPPVFEMPFLESVNTKAILELRKTEAEAFNEYRIAIDQASKHYLTVSNNIEARDVYDDIIYPAFAKLDSMFKRVRRAHALKTFCELSIVSSSVTLGLIADAIPKDPFAIMAALGGSELLVSQIGNVIDRKINNRNDLEQQDFYFLWKLKNQ